ncbi:hypothetical protein SKAU_G00193040 [Synaphobranchus kaupii]|uniref:Uncharacterized protein n=1 Tax=Synaphobranchus kaupii TaxID=118154 RepID=A0A9Q1FEB8_SYNKA|nr:hypothetical protein SKAU_G00193040 [Synaphobranchus kaupii]
MRVNSTLICTELSMCDGLLWLHSERLPVYFIVHYLGNRPFCRVSEFSVFSIENSETIEMADPLNSALKCIGNHSEHSPGHVEVEAL